jgi:hypothetical protein
VYNDDAILIGTDCTMVPDEIPDPAKRRFGRATFIIFFSFDHHVLIFG